MARADRRRPENAPGPWFVDDSCIDCDVSRQCARPDRRGWGQSAVARQPTNPSEEAALARAMLACPSASIGTTGSAPDVEGVLPALIEDDVWFLGYTSRRAFGANPFFAMRETGNVMIDGPRFVRRLVRWMEDRGGLRDVMLTHRDDLGDAERYARQFNARVWIHEADADVAPFATHIIRGEAPASIRPDVSVVPVPGHTRGSVIYLLARRFAFTGDSLFWSREHDTLWAFRDACWYSWSSQADSLARLADHDFEWVLPGHGGRACRPPSEMRARLQQLVERMRVESDPVWRSDTW